MKHFGLRAKFILLLLVILVTLFSIAAYILVHQNSVSLRATLNEQSKAFAKLATKPIGDTFLLYQDSGRIRIKQQVDKFLELNPDISRVTVVDVNGKNLFDTEAERKTEISQKAAVSFEPVYTQNKKGEVTQVVQPFLEDFGQHRYSIVYEVSSERVDAAISQERLTILALSAVAMLISVILAYQLINGLFLRPVRKVSSSALIISQGDLQQQVGVEREDEIGDLAEAVNTMANSLKADIIKLQEVDKLKSEFMMIAAHNLRTPLVTINGYLEMLNSLGLPAETKKMLEAISANSIRLGSFSEDMLIISGLESGEMSIKKEPTALTPLLERISSDFKVLASQKKLQFSAKVATGEHKANLSNSHFRSAIWNLLDNAFKFTAESGKVDFTAEIRDKDLVISVADDGVGIADSEMPKLFTKFHRGTSTLKYDYEGTGIGLYLTKLIIEQHGGMITAKSAEGKGSLFVITMPLTNLEEPAQQPATL